MFRMAVGHSDEVDAEDAVAEVLEQCDRALGGLAPRAGLLFTAWENDAAAILAAVRRALPDIELAGTTSAGEMSSVVGFREDSVALALFASETVDITAGIGRGVVSDPEGAARRALEMAREKSAQVPRLCVAIPSASSNTTPVIASLRRELGEGVAILGGGSAPSVTPGQPPLAVQLCGDEAARDAVVVLLFSGPLVYSFGIDTGWTPIGRRGVITRASDGVVHEIDGEPASAFYERYLGKGAQPAAANPLAVFEDGADDFYLRVPIVHVPETGAVVVAGSVPEGAQVQLSVAVTDEIFGGVRSAVSKAVERYPKAAGPDAALVFSCAVRKRLLGSRTGTEVDITREQLGSDLPLFGFYCFGEIAPLDSGTDHFHNETIVAVLLGAS